MRRRSAEHMVQAIQELKASNNDLTDALKAANDNFKDVREYFEAYKDGTSTGTGRSVVTRTSECVTIATSIHKTTYPQCDLAHT